MATLIPSIGSARFDTGGECRLAERLRDFLEGNAYVWHNLPVGPLCRHPDFVIVHPNQGILVLEVKDWRLDSILGVTKTDVELMTEAGAKRVQSPFEQVRRYLFDVMKTVERDRRLLFGSGPYKGHPILPFGFGVVFTNITRKQFEQTDLADAFSAERCVFKDEMTESCDPDTFRKQLWSMVSRRLGPPLSAPQFDRLRALLFPEVRIRQIALPLEEEHPEESADDRLMAVMDMQQEQLARSLGDGHRIIRGVAGSGKTLILAFRAEYLARAATKPVLILSYANGIAGRLEDAMRERGVADRVEVATFHSWCYRMLKTYDIPAPTFKDYPNSTDRLHACVKTVCASVEGGLIPGGQYDGVLIDEAHDFEPQWLSLAARMVDRDKRSLLIAYDDMQAIYKGRAPPVWKQLGIEARGRTTVLKVNYRNTAQILGFARRFASDVISAPGVQADQEDPVLLPEDAGRQGVEPEIRQCASFGAEAHAIAEWLMARKAAGYDWRQMAVLFPEHHIGGHFERALAKLEIPVDVAKAHKNRVRVAVDAVRLLSMHTAKGLEFPCVAIGGLGALGQHGTIEDDIRLTYVAVTRATHEAFLTYSRVSPLVERLAA